MKHNRRLPPLLIAAAFVLLLLAAFLLGRASTGQTLRVETQKHGVIAAPVPQTAQTPQTSADALCINTASREELMQLPGVGPVLAGRITEYRARYGRFVSVRQLMDVEGIGEELYAALEPLVCVEEYDENSGS